MAGETLDDFKVGKIEAGEGNEPTGSATEKQTTSPDKDKFDSMLQQEKTQTQPLSEASSEKQSLMQTVRDMNYAGTAPGKVTPEHIAAQTKEAIQRIEGLKQTLETPNISLKASTQQLLNNKLQHIDDSLRIALSKTGVEFNPTAEVSQTLPRANPIERFLGFLTDGQWKLENLGKELKTMSLTQELSPVDMLAIQVKVTQIQQELELFSSLLNKGLESIKTIMNVQV